MILEFVHTFFTLLKAKKRAKIWKSVVSGETVSIVGTRSALLPFKNLV